MWKSFGFVANEKYIGFLILLLVGLVFSRYEFSDRCGFETKKCGRGVGAGQDRCQDFAAGRPKPQGGPHFLNTILDVRRNRGPNIKWRTHILKGVAGAGQAPLASPLATTLVCVRSLRGGSGQEFSNSCRSGQKISTLTGLCCRKTAALDKSSDAEFMSAS